MANKTNTNESLQKMEFETWFAMREKAIPQQHRREILKADFKAQGVKTLSTMSEFDKALKKYGVVLG
jgi:hypothetical protein